MPDEVRVVGPGTLPKTSSGKLQRAKTRTLFEAGDLRRREDDGALKIAGRLAQSQLAHLKLAIFGARK
jgi:acyl-coenzyme A synthetase/AMP-(fatty) acid ligase